MKKTNRAHTARIFITYLILAILGTLVIISGVYIAQVIGVFIVPVG